MTKHYVLEYDNSGTQRGVPKLLRGTLNHDWQWDESDPDPEKFQITADYEYRAKHSVVDFDYSEDGILVSENFADLCEEFGMVLRRIPVRMIQSDGGPAKKRYCFALTSTWVSAVDFERAGYVVGKSIETGEPYFEKHLTEVPHVESIDKLVIDDAKIGALGIVRAVDVVSKHVCTEAFKRECERRKLLGIRFVAADEFAYAPFWSTR